MEKKKVLVPHVCDFVNHGDDIYYSRYEEDARSVYKYEKKYNPQILSTDAFDDDGLDILGDLKYSYGDNVVFVGDNGEIVISVYDCEKEQWNKFSLFQFENSDYYFRRWTVNAHDDYLYIEGIVCDRTKSSLAGPYEVKKAKENGIWRINIRTGEKEQISTSAKYRGMYMLDGSLYGMYQGKVEKIN